MEKIAAGHYRIGIYHARRVGSSRWEITVEDGKGLPFEPITLGSLRAFQVWCGA